MDESITRQEFDISARKQVPQHKGGGRIDSQDLEGQLYPRADPYRGWVLVPGPLPDALVILRKAVGLIDW